MQSTWVLVSGRQGTKIFEVIEPYHDELKLVRELPSSGFRNCNQPVIEELAAGRSEFSSLILVAVDSHLESLLACLPPEFRSSVIGAVPEDHSGSEPGDILAAIGDILSFLEQRQEYAA